MLGHLTKQQNKPKLLLCVPNRDVSQIKTLFGVFNEFFGSVKPDGVQHFSVQQVLSAADKHGATFIGTTSFETLKLFDPYLQGSANDNLGTIITHKVPSQSGSPDREYRICLLPPLSYQWTKNEGLFLIRHFLQKLLRGTPVRKDRFVWEFVSAEKLDACVALLNSAWLVAVDIETTKEDLRITSVSYTAGYFDDAGNVYTRSFVVRCDHEHYPFCISAVRRLNMTPAPKIMQNGQYDAAYFLRFNAPLLNYRYDTMDLFHAIYAELPKDLAYISSFLLDNFRYWKDESGTNLYEYNAKDTHNTFWVFLALLEHAPDYTYYNYCIKFKIVFPALSCALEGMDVNEQEMKANWERENSKALNAQTRLAYLLSEPDFNPGSPKQVMQMFKMLGYHKAADSTDLTMTKFAEENPIYEPIAELITQYREAVKARSTYFQLDLLNGKLMYQIVPSGTKSGRSASKSSMFWCGTQIQNIPVYARGMVVAQPGWTFSGVDKSQSESYCTGYISQDLNLIRTVTTSPDFHCQNASMFFGIPFAELYDTVAKKVLNKPIRKLAKPINHGANYNMTAPTLKDTIIKQMGSKAIIQIKTILRLPKNLSLTKVCQVCLDKFDKTYPTLRSRWYGEIILEIFRTGKLTSPDGFVRRTFLQPSKSKDHLNEAVAHKPQSFSVHLVNEAWFKIWRELQLKKYRGSFRLKAQVHDELVTMLKDEIAVAAAQDVADMMVIPTVIHGRTMTIPSTIALGKTWGDLKD